MIEELEDTLPYRVTVGIDELGGDLDPNDRDGLLVLKHWNTRLIHSVDPVETIGCTFEPEDDDENEKWVDEVTYGPCEGFEWWKIHTDPDTPFYHEYKPAEQFVTWLKYFEHGMCRWMRQDAYFPYDPGDWDTSKHAGVLVIGDGNEEEWDGMTKEQQDSFIDAFLSEYTAWSNGEIYYITLEKRLAPTSCECCHQRTNEDFEFVDSLGGIIDGDGDYVKSIIKEMLQEAGVEDPTEDEDYEIVERYG